MEVVAMSIVGITIKPEGFWAGLGLGLGIGTSVTAVGILLPYVLVGTVTTKIVVSSVGAGLVGLGLITAGKCAVDEKPPGTEK